MCMKSLEEELKTAKRRLSALIDNGWSVNCVQTVGGKWKCFSGYDEVMGEGDTAEEAIDNALEKLPCA